MIARNRCHRCASRATKINLWSLFIILLLIVGQSSSEAARRRNRSERCPRVRAMRNFDLTSMMGYWYVIQYFASSETLAEYSCMQSSFGNSDGFVTMNFTYYFSDDPLKNFQQGNITWVIPNYSQPAHWIHAEWTYEEVYNTYVIDTDYKSWGLVMHCAEKTKTQKYLSALMLSRQPTLTQNVINFLREKLPRYDIDLQYMFPIPQENCTTSGAEDPKKYFKYETL
ncbi:apolipoprotein D [Toxorhynchites rutilus septentrionalis]|uniref:apolipoprotein D n=1 Tax=Toxorhynchites rutilus septentrionalis TaxID=329112 RepID=UPI002479C924|nr:apolipoprotein D [Toxorhynchites rutilus septentrionalis]